MDEVNVKNGGDGRFLVASGSTEAFAQGILDSLPEPAILINRRYEVLLSNEAYRDRYGLISSRPNRLTRPKCHEVSHHSSVPCDEAGESCPLKACLETGGRARTLHIHYSTGGREYVNVEMWPIRDPDSGDIEYFIEQIFPVEEMIAVDPAERRPMIGASRAFRTMVDMAQRVAPSEATVLLLGETGAGKDLIAQMVHRLSKRAEAPFVPVECTGLPESLFESELFGYVKGAFTGADREKLGLVEAAEGGTLFLDEVGEIPLAEQVKLLRLLETRRFRKVGSADWKKADFRLVCATNRDLWSMVERGEFRADLFYRLSVFEIELPPLRERSEDIPLLVERILDELGANNITVSQEAISLLTQYEFPGNVRELRNLVERAVLLADDDVILPQHLPGHLTLCDVEPEAVPLKTLEQVEREYLEKTVSQWRGDRKSLAAALDISERVLYRKLAALKGRNTTKG